MDDLDFSVSEGRRENEDTCIVSYAAFKTPRMELA